MFSEKLTRILTSTPSLNKYIPERKVLDGMDLAEVAADIGTNFKEFNQAVSATIGRLPRTEYMKIHAIWIRQKTHNPNQLELQLG